MPLAPQRRGHNSARPLFLLVSVLALLALLSVPGFAQAESSSGIQYESDELKSGVTESSNIPSAEKSPKAHSSNTPPGSDDSESASEESSTGGGGTGTGGDSGNGKGNEGSGSGDKQQSGGSKDAGSISGSKALASAGEPIPGTGGANSSSSSSPLVPILIAVAVLAAISVGAVLYRQRKQRPGSSVSPKAS